MSQLARVITTAASPMLQERVAIRIDLGVHGHRTLIYNAESMAWLKQQTKRNPLRGEFVPTTVTDVVYFLYACTLPTQGTEGKLTYQQLADAISITQFKEAFNIVLRLMTNRNLESSQLAPYMPTPPKVIAAALTLAGLKTGEIFLDIGCGDGRALALAHKRGAGAVYGYEVDGNRAKIAQALIEQVGAEGAVFQESIVGDGWLLHQPHVVFAYLLGDAMVMLKPYLERLPKGTRIVSHDFVIEGWDAREKQEVVGDDREAPHTLYLYTVGDHIAREIDMTKPLSVEDSQYLAAKMAEALAEMGDV